VTLADPKRRTDERGKGQFPAPSTSSAVAVAREYGPLVLAFFASRLALYGAGLRFKLDLSWMFLDDLAALHHHLLQTVYYFHAFAPGMNLLTGALLKIDADHVLALATAAFWLCGALLAVSLYRVLYTLGYTRWPAMLLALAFSLLPQTLFLENLYLYTYLCAGLLCCAAALFHRALRLSTAWNWFWFFITASTLGYLYTVFHLLWFGLMLALALALQARHGDVRHAFRAVARGAVVPALLLTGLYAKNYALFGVFGATSWGPSNMTLATTQLMPPAERDGWIREGKLSRYAAINVYAPPSSYLPLLSSSNVYPWPGSNELIRPSVGEGNYNHGLFLEVNEARRNDVAYYLANRPMDYVRRVFTRNLPGLFHPTTHWHPNDKRPQSPHAQHRSVLGVYERWYDRLVHSWPVPKVGLYVFLPLFLGWAALAAWTRLRANDASTRAAGALLGFCLFQILFVIGTSSLFTAWETARYRYAIEPCIWIVVVVALRAAHPRVKGWVSILHGVRRKVAPDPTGDMTVS
jgi:hypothetical protein